MSLWTLGTHAPTRPITDFFMFSVSNALSKRAIATDDKCKFLDIFHNNYASFSLKPKEFRSIICFSLASR